MPIALPRGCLLPSTWTFMSGTYITVVIQPGPWPLRGARAEGTDLEQCANNVDEKRANLCPHLTGGGMCQTCLH